MAFAPLDALWVVVHSVAACAGSNGPAGTAASVDHFLRHKDVVSSQRISNVPLSQFTAGADPTQLLTDTEAEIQATLTDNGLDGDTYTNDAAWSNATTFLDMELHVLNHVAPLPQLNRLIPA